MRSGVRRKAACSGLATADGALKDAVLEICRVAGGATGANGGKLLSRQPAGGPGLPLVGRRRRRCCHQRAATRGRAMTSHGLHKACGGCCRPGGGQGRRARVRPARQPCSHAHWATIRHTCLLLLSESLLNCRDSDMAAAAARVSLHRLASTPQRPRALLLSVLTPATPMAGALSHS